LRESALPISSTRAIDNCRSTIRHRRRIQAQIIQHGIDEAVTDDDPTDRIEQHFRIKAARGGSTFELGAELDIEAGGRSCRGPRGRPRRCLEGVAPALFLLPLLRQPSLALLPTPSTGHLDLLLAAKEIHQHLDPIAWRHAGVKPEQTGL
jgi:hypothetical protein